MQQLTFEEHVAGLRRAVDAFAEHAVEAGAEAPVPTCPSWTVRKLVAHQGMVHRWARASLLGQENHPPDWNGEGQQVADPVGWLREGADALAGTIASVPDDVRASVFLKDAPAPRLFWARRQCHETTIHAVDALAARLGRVPGPGDVGWVPRTVALDGVDELLTGFVTRGRGLKGAGPTRFRVRAGDEPRGWSLDVAPDGAVDTMRADGLGDDPGADLPTVSGSALALYLTLWNRAQVECVDDPAGVLARVWRDGVRVRWS